MKIKQRPIDMDFIRAGHEGYDRIMMDRLRQDGKRFFTPNNRLVNGEMGHRYVLKGVKPITIEPNQLIKNWDDKLDKDTLKENDFQPEVYFGDSLRMINDVFVKLAERHFGFLDVKAIDPGNTKTAIVSGEESINIPGNDMLISFRKTSEDQSVRRDNHDSIMKSKPTTIEVVIIDQAHGAGDPIKRISVQYPTIPGHDPVISYEDNEGNNVRCSVSSIGQDLFVQGQDIETFKRAHQLISELHDTL